MSQSQQSPAQAPPSAGEVAAASARAETEHLPPWIRNLGIGMAFAYGAFVILLWRLGLFDVPAGGADARVFAAVFALMGALFGALLTFVGALLKHSIDTRTVELAKQTERRLQAEGRQTEARLTLDTAIRAVDLLSSSDGAKSPSTQQAGALFALTQLNQTGLALALLAEVWPREDVSPEAALWVIDQALRSDDPIAQLEASNLYLENAARLRISNEAGFQIPACAVNEWPLRLPYFVRLNMIAAYIHALATGSRKEWSDSIVGGLIFAFNQIRMTDPAIEIRDAATMVLATLLKEVTYDLLAGEPGESPLDVEQLKEEIQVEAERASPHDFVRSALDQLRATW